jgi:hypothetical protein
MQLDENATLEFTSKGLSSDVIAISQVVCNRNTAELVAIQPLQRGTSRRG